MSKRIHNILFALIIGLILGVTVYAIETQMPQMSARELPVKIQNESPPLERTKAANETEKMIDRGELSNHEGKYYKTVTE